MNVAMKMAKKTFFDKAAVTRAVANSQTQVLRKIGAYIRRTARGLIKKRKNISAPGAPPNSHTSLLRNFVLFDVDKQSNSVVIGAQLTRPGNTAPRALEHGGTSFSVERGRRKINKVRPRPFMGPALAANVNQIAELWRNSVKAR